MLISIKISFLATYVLVLYTNPSPVQGHGYLVEPPSRGLVNGYGDKMSMFCGGIGVQFNEVNKGRCGECGDPYSQVRPRDNEVGGRLIRRRDRWVYEQGSAIQVKVKLTAAHKGMMEFRICDVGGPNNRVDQACLDQNVLKIAGTDQTQYRGDNNLNGAGLYHVSLQLPTGFTGNYTTLQWRYKTGNSWGTDEGAKQGCLGCGNQEHFQNCADISIIPRGSKKPATSPYPPPTTPAPAAVTETMMKTTMTPASEENEDNEANEVPDFADIGSEPVPFTCECPKPFMDHLHQKCEEHCRYCDKMPGQLCPTSWYQPTVNNCRYYNCKIKRNYPRF